MSPQGGTASSSPEGRGKRSKGSPSSGGRGGSLLAKENRRLLYGLLIGAIVAIFAFLNLDEVEVNWIFGTAQTPLILVIAITFLLGALTGWIADAGRRRAKS